MNAHAYSDPTARSSHSAKRYARHHVGDHSPIPAVLPRKTAEVVTLVPRQQKLGDMTTPGKNHRAVLLVLLLVGVAHLAVGWQFLNQPEPVITKAEIPPMTMEFYRPPVEQPPEPPQPREEPPPPKPEPVVEKPKPVIKKTPPKPVEPLPEPVNEVVEPEPAPAPVSPPPAEPVLIQASADAGYLRNPAPRYPDLAQRQGWEGTVVLNVHVLANGRPSAVEIKESSGHKMLDDSALQTVKRWRFVPAKRGDVATDSWVEVPIDFRLAAR